MGLCAAGAIGGGLSMAASSHSALAVRHVAFEDAGLLEDLLSERGYKLEYCDAGVDPIDAARLLAPDILIVLGGPIGVYETREYPFLEKEIESLRVRSAAEKPTLGVCLGAQMIAAALGARVAPGPTKEIGYALLDLTDAGRGSGLASLEGVPVLHWHGDNLDLPEGCTRLASTRACPTQAFARGSRMLGLQFHIETRARSFEKWLIGHAVELSRAGLDPCALRAQAANDGAAMETAGAIALSAWLDGALA